MRCLILLAFVAVACAQYDYQPTSQSGEAILSNSIDSGLAPGVAESSHDSPALADQSAIDKEYYTFSADDNDFNDNKGQEAASSLKQNLRVVFIKSPENRGLEDAALALAKQAGEQQTAIYVLKKQTDISDLANKLNSINKSSNNKPEVHFVKYRTPEDAANAQKAIQDQYDGLGGNSKNVDGGVAPVLNFASSAPLATQQNSDRAIEGPSNSYNAPAASNEGTTYSLPSAAEVEAPSNSFEVPAATAANSFTAPAAAPSSSYFAPVPATSNSYNQASELGGSAPFSSYNTQSAINTYNTQTSSGSINSYNTQSSSASINSYNSQTASGSINSYIPPAAPVAAAPTSVYGTPNTAQSEQINSYGQPAENPNLSYIPPEPVAEEISTSYLPASILRLFRL